MSSVKQDTAQILEALVALATVEALSSLGTKVDALSAKIDALTAQHADTSATVSNNQPILQSIATAVGA